MIPLGQLAKKSIPFVVFAALSAGLTTGAYRLLEKFFRDRQSALSSPRLPERASVRGKNFRSETQTGTEKNGKPANQTSAQASAQAAAEAGQAAIQRQLKTLEDINNINEMNRRLMEQQRRMQNQR